MDALAIIQREHRAIAAVCHCFEQILKEVESGQLEPPFELFELIINYIRDFPDRFHHPKEDDYLFAKLRVRAPEVGEIIDALQEQHHDGLDRTLALGNALEAYRNDPEAGFPQFQKTSLEYIDFQRRHIAKEEREIMPAARKALTPEDRHAIDEAFANNEDPIFGSAPKSEFDGLFSKIVATAPEPWGLKSRTTGEGDDDHARTAVVNLNWV